VQAVNIAGRWIGPQSPPYIVAEMSGNHNGSLERAFQIVRAAKDAGADAVKLQTYTAQSMTLDVEHPRFRVHGDNPWGGEHLFSLYERAATPWEWHKPLFELGNKIGITVFSTPFDFAAVELLESLGTPAYKIASFEVVDLELIRRCAETRKPLFISTGTATLPEIAEAVQTARDARAQDLILLKCTSAYPAPPEEMNLRTIGHMAQAFDVLTGLSDHTLGLGVAIASTALGAVAIEKHVTLSQADGGVDSSFSLEPAELAELVVETRRAHAALGQVTYTPGDREAAFARYRRSLFFVRDVRAGARIGREDVRALRPGDGLPPKFLQAVIGRAARTDLVRGTPVSWELLA
jgi:N-acetylneuraminate synthase